MASSLFINSINEFLEYMSKDQEGEIGVEWVKWTTVINYFLSKDGNAFDCYKQFLYNENVNGNTFPDFTLFVKIIDDINNEVRSRKPPKEYQFCYDLWGYTHH
jgi:hypothetical protein